MNNEQYNGLTLYWPRALPFLVFLGLTGLQGQFSGAAVYWIYTAKTVIGAWLLWTVRRRLPELGWKMSGLAVAGGVLVFLLWVGLDGFYPKLGKASPWNPPAQFGEGAPAAWFFIAVRLAGSTLVVPPLEEVFYRSFIYRYIAARQFLEVPLTRFLPLPFFATAGLFALEHREWLPGLLAGFVYQGLVLRRGCLGEAIAAHALTNLLLGLYVIKQGAWSLW